MDSNIAYKVKRSTAVLALHSVTLSEYGHLRPALEKLAAVNFDLERLDNETLQVLYVGLDDAFTAKVLAEFEFERGLGAVRDNRACVAVCNLCGKGDSRDDGANRDHLRYEFRLANKAGGTEVWTGSTCIINHAIKVQGAANADEARRILEKVFREHLARWRIEQWQGEHPDHVEIPRQFEQFRTLPRDLSSYGRYSRHEGEAMLMGIDLSTLSRDAMKAFKPFRAAVRKYQRDGHLGFGKAHEPSEKQHAWDRAKRVLTETARFERALLDAAQVTDPDERIAHFARLRDEREAEAAEAQARPRARNPRSASTI